MTGPAAALLPDGRLHLQHGPIDLVVGADGAPNEVRQAFDQAEMRFDDILPTLVSELDLLRSQSQPDGLGANGPVAQRMDRSAARHAQRFVTPMVAVAGAVADEMLGALTMGRRLSRAYVNNGGDIAVMVSPGSKFVAGLIADPREGIVVGRVTVRHDDGIRGIATSGRHGRSLSRGIADAVTVVAEAAADADAAATMIANAVDLPGSTKVERARACEVDTNSDLGDLDVVTGVESLTADELTRALASGTSVADEFLSRGMIKGAALFLAGEYRVVGGEMQLSVALPDQLNERMITHG